MRLVEIENELKKQIEKDINSPEVYNWIFELVYKWFLRGKVVRNYQEAREISRDMAEYLYLRLLDPNKEKITSWLGYISKAYKVYIKDYLKFENQVIDTSNNVELAKGIIRMSAASTIDNDSISQIYNNGYIKSISALIDNILDSSRFYPNTSNYNNAKISLLLSVGNGRFMPFRLSIEDSMYTRMLFQVLNDRLAIELHPTEFLSGNELTRLFMLDLDDTDYEGGWEVWDA